MTKQGLKSEYGMREKRVIEALGSDQLYRELRIAGWLTPIINRHKLLLFDSGQVAQCWARLLAGEVPTKKQKTD